MYKGISTSYLYVYNPDIRIYFILVNFARNVMIFRMVPPLADINFGFSVYIKYFKKKNEYVRG